MESGPAFPVTYHHTYGDESHSCGGMSLRDWFAGMAMQGLLAHSCDQEKNLISQPASKVAATAYAMADAMLKERE